MTSISPAQQDLLDGFVPFPAEFAESYRAAGYWRGEPLGELLRDAARGGPRRPALHT
ncbi:2,3-dihydroxybenzoate-AMP ligase, partial [Nocardia nova]|nr:2,3-dihydroxybenzoate-AMP ligase [Nocardia nova]